MVCAVTMDTCKSAFLCIAVEADEASAGSVPVKFAHADPYELVKTRHVRRCSLHWILATELGIIRLVVCILKGYNAVIANITRSNFEELYGDIKERLCCDISNTSRTLWISWTVTVAVAGHFLILKVTTRAHIYWGGGGDLAVKLCWL